MANPFLLGTVGDCGCCNSDCGAVCFSEISCGSDAMDGVAATLISGGALTGLTDVSNGSNYTAQPYATVSGDGCGAAVNVTWSAPSSGTSGNTTSTGSPATVANNASVGVEAWTIPGAAGALADVALDGRPLGSDTTEYLVLTGLGGLSGISDTASITGMQATISGTLSDSRATDWHAKWCIGGTIEGTDLASGTGDLSAGSLVYGGSSNTAGLTLTGADIKASNSGFAVAFQVGAHTDTVSITSVTLKFWWTTPGTGGITGYTIVNGGVGYTSATITVHRGVRDTTGSGASVTVASYSAITTVDSGTTNYNVQSIALTQSGFSVDSGSGYTNGTGYALGFSGGSPTTAATGTFDVVGGHVTNLQLTGHGNSYASTPTISFPGAGTPTVAAQATATMFHGVCFSFATGTIYGVKATKTGYDSTCSMLIAKCPQKYSVNAYGALQATTLFLTDNNGTWTLTGNATSGWTGCFTATFANVLSVPALPNCNNGTVGSGTAAFQYTFTCNPMRLTICALSKSPSGSVFGPYHLVASDCSGSPRVSPICSDLGLAESTCVGIFSFYTTSPAFSTTFSGTGVPWTFTAPTGGSVDSDLNTGSVVIST